MPKSRKDSEVEPARELRRMDREELIEVIFTLRQETQLLQQENEELTEQLKDRTIRLGKAGSIAEAALSLNHVFESAQDAADQYLLSVKSKAEAESEAAEMISSAKAEAEDILKSARAEADGIIRQSEEQAKETAEKFARSVNVLFRKNPGLAEEWMKSRQNKAANSETAIPKETAPVQNSGANKYKIYPQNPVQAAESSRAEKI